MQDKKIKCCLNCHFCVFNEGFAVGSICYCNNQNSIYFGFFLPYFFSVTTDCDCANFEESKTTKIR